MSINKAALHRLSIVFSLLFSTFLYADDSDHGFYIILKPEQCVAVHQGNDCFINLDVFWHGDQPLNACIFMSTEKRPIACWKNQYEGRVIRELATKENVTFTLKTEDEVITLASETLIVSWVYRKNTRSQTSWRMF